MKVSYDVIKLVSALSLSLVLFACSSEEDSLALNQSEAVNLASSVTSEISNNGTGKALVHYQMPTYIGADQFEQEALLKQLDKQSLLTLLEQKQQLLLRLTLFSSDKNQTLKKLEAITQDLTLASELSGKNGAQDYELMAAMGSALSYQSIFYQNDLGKMNLISRKGMRYMDRAVKKSPEHLGVRLFRGVSYANMPAFLNRASFAVTDLSLLKHTLLSDGVVKKRSNKKQDKLFIEFINYYLALSLSKNAQLEAAKKLWQALETNSTSQWSALASARLKEA